METAALNYWAILVAALSAFLVGGMWYSPAVFGKTWMKENGFSEADLKGGNGDRNYYRCVEVNDWRLAIGVWRFGPSNQMRVKPRRCF